MFCGQYNCITVMSPRHEYADEYFIFNSREDVSYASNLTYFPIDDYRFHPIISKYVETTVGNLLFTKTYHNCLEEYHASKFVDLVDSSSRLHAFSHALYFTCNYHKKCLKCKVNFAMSIEGK